MIGLRNAPVDFQSILESSTQPKESGDAPHAPTPDAKAPAAEKKKNRKYPYNACKHILVVKTKYRCFVRTRQTTVTIKAASVVINPILGGDLPTLMFFA